MFVYMSFCFQLYRINQNGVRGMIVCNLMLRILNPMDEVAYDVDYHMLEAPFYLKHSSSQVGKIYAARVNIVVLKGTGTLDSGMEKTYFLTVIGLGFG